jgi:hypothetical protein
MNLWVLSLTHIMRQDHPRKSQMRLYQEGIAFQFSISVTNCYFHFTDFESGLHKFSWMSWCLILCPSIVFHVRILYIVYKCMKCQKIGRFYYSIAIFLYKIVFVVMILFLPIIPLVHWGVLNSLISLFLVLMFAKQEKSENIGQFLQLKVKRENISSN